MKGATATALLRPALEAAVDVARAGEKATPVTPAPAPLRRYLNFARLPDPALEVARRVLDDDEEFRNRVADASAEDVVGRPGWLYLQRPEGWQAELDRLLQEAAAAEMAAKDERHERGAQRRLAGAEAALARAESAARAKATEALTAQHTLQAEREAAVALAEEVERLRSQLEQLSAERGELIRRLKGAEATANQRTSELRAARHELRMVQAELAGGDVAVPAPAPAAAEPAPPVAEPAPPPPGPDLDRLRVLTAALVDLVGLPETAAEERPEIEPPSVTGRERPPRRIPAGPPPGVYDDTPEAAEHLVRVPGVLVLVDGYNISHAQWHGMPPFDQRSRLLGACAELHARCGTDIEVVFDGAGEVPGYGGSSHDGVRHQFTPAGVEADDVILDRIGQEPLERAVVVVSSDRRVRDGARRRGADVLGARQFLGVLRRAHP